MPIWIALPLCALVSLIAMPVRLGFLKLPGAPLRVGLSVGPARRQAALALALDGGWPALRLISAGGEKRIPLARSRAGAAAKPLRRAVIFLMKRFRADRLEADVNVDTGDACGTALLTALVGAALSALDAAYPAAPLKRRVSCTFRREGAARFMGIFSARAGHIMLAALVFSRDYCFGRIRAWTSTPSKTS